MGRRRIRVADVKEILVQWDAGASISGTAHSLGYSRPTVRKYVQAGQRVGLVRGSRRVDEVGWERAARAAMAQVAAEPRVGDASLAIAAYHEHLAERVGTVFSDDENCRTNCLTGVCHPAAGCCLTEDYTVASALVDGEFHARRRPS